MSEQHGQFDHASAAEQIWRARTARKPIDMIPAAARPATVADGYLVQDALHVLLAREGCGRPVGYKIGCTSTAMQEYLGIDEPCAGAIWSSGLHRGSATVSRSRFRALGIEGELAVTLGTDADPDRRYEPESAAALVSSWHPAIELVDNRYGDFTGLGAPTLIADDFFGAGGVLGGPIDLPRGGPGAIEATLLIDDEPTDTGSGSEILGDPRQALAWLANHTAARGNPLVAGAVVFLGSVFRVHWIGESARAALHVHGCEPTVVQLDDLPSLGPP